PLHRPAHRGKLRVNSEGSRTIMNEVASRCIAIIARSKSIPPDTITSATTFDELSVDSLDMINISFEVEEAFNIEIPDEALGSIKTVGDMVDGINKLSSTTHPPAASTP
ncbi:MAG: acyl carrier protein, partial [Edaphobacter sp.]